VPPDAIAALERLFDEDERGQFQAEPVTPPASRQRRSVPASYRTKDALSFYLQPVPPGAWTNEVTVRSGRGRAFRCLPWAVRGDEQRRRILVSSASDRGL
jgi:uncharacterized protein